MAAWALWRPVCRNVCFGGSLSEEASEPACLRAELCVQQLVQNGLCGQPGETKLAGVLTCARMCRLSFSYMFMSHVRFSLACIIRVLVAWFIHSFDACTFPA